MDAVAPVTARAPTDTRPLSAGATSPEDAKPERNFWQRVFGDDGLTFSTLLDVVNPLQHIPVVSTIYREITGDKIAPGAKLIGDTLFGGPIGLAFSAFDLTVQGETGKDMGEHVVAMLTPSAPANTDLTVAAAMDKAAPSEAIGAPDGAPREPQPSPIEKAQVKNGDVEQAKAGTAPVQLASLTPPSSSAQGPEAAAMRSAFVAAAMRPRNAANGVGGAFVPLETRSTIAPQAMFNPGSASAPAEATKRLADKGAGDKSAGTVPDAKAVAANPEMLRSLRANGVRPTASQATPRAAPALAAAPATDPSDADGTPNEFGEVMARNLERYMALRNHRPAPTTVDRAL